MADDLDDELRGFAERTEGVHASPGFEARVLTKIQSETPAWDAGVLRFGRAMLFVAALSAVVGVFAGVRSADDETDASATAYGMEELDW
ncbi:MAG TPA: hypothetical protein VHE30_23475 [Polyangiaceae bacterium]|nr:hypothetical protein [Polyangiaceae bacterium]